MFLYWVSALKLFSLSITLCLNNNHCISLLFMLLRFLLLLHHYHYHHLGILFWQLASTSNYWFLQSLLLNSEIPASQTISSSATPEWCLTAASETFFSILLVTGRRYAPEWPPSLYSRPKVIHDQPSGIIWPVTQFLWHVSDWDCNIHIGKDISPSQCYSMTAKLDWNNMF